MYHPVIPRTSRHISSHSLRIITMVCHYIFDYVYISTLYFIRSHLLHKPSRTGPMSLPCTLYNIHSRNKRTQTFDNTCFIWVGPPARVDHPEFSKAPIAAKQHESCEPILQYTCSSQQDHSRHTVQQMNYLPNITHNHHTQPYKLFWSMGPARYIEIGL